MRSSAASDVYKRQGSINQRVFVLSKRGIELAEYMFSLKQREIEIEITPEGVFVIGIPSKNLKGII
jgi:hypothetical protein